jgi:putative PIN family toxin of toxin-antitoxin system
VRIVLDTAILVRGHGSTKGLARDLLIGIVESDHVLLLSNEMIYELAKVLRYPRMMALHGLSEGRIYDYVGFLRKSAEMVVLNALLVTPIRDVNDTAVMQTAVIGEGDVLLGSDTFGGGVDGRMASVAQKTTVCFTEGWADTISKKYSPFRAYADIMQS